MKMAGKEEKKNFKKKNASHKSSGDHGVEEYMLYKWINTDNFYSRKLLNLQIYKFTTHHDR